jgi:hypothetical protein
VLSVATPWGLARHWWVVVKLALTVGVIVFRTLHVGVWVIEGIERRPRTLRIGVRAGGRTSERTWAPVEAEGHR